MEVSIKITFVYCSLFLLAYGILLLVTVQHAQALTSAEVATNRTDTDTITDERTEKQALDGNSTIDGEGDTLTIEEGGSVTDNTADSVVVDNDDNTVTNKGSITVSGANKTGVNMQSGSNNTLNNFGTISVDAGITGTAVNINANTDSTVNNYGTISISSSTNSTGINTRNSSATINNYGTISVNSDGASSRAIRIDGTGYTINNFGTIEVTGENDIGILFVTSANDTNTINNSGSITASGTSSFAIQGSDGDETLNLQSGSRIIGAIDLAGGTDKVTISGRNISSTLTIENAETFNLHVPGIVVGNVVTTVDPTGQSVKGPVLNSLCTGLHGVLHKRLASFKPAPINLASTRIEPGMLAKSKQPQAWGNMFHSYRKRAHDDLLFAYDHEYNGFTGGFERTFKKARIGIMGGYSRANVEADTESFRTDSNSYFGGAYGQYDFGRIKLAASLIGGYEDHDNARMVVDNLNDDETARADFGSIFLSPSVSVRADYKAINRLLFRPSATVVYSAGWYDDYHEHGTTRSNLTIDDRTLQALNGTLQLSAIYKIADWCDFELSAGGSARYTDDGSIDGNLGGTDFRFSATNDNSVYSGQLGAYLNANVTDRLDLYANAEFRDASGGETRDFFMAGFKFSF